MTHLRDGHDVADGASFRVDLPRGRWDVTVHFGHPWENRHFDRIDANGVTIGRDLTSFARYWRIFPNERAARGIVDVADDGLVLSFHGESPMGVLAVEAYPYVESPKPNVVAGNDPKAALAQAMAIPDVMERSIALAWILGYPTSPQPWHFETADRVIQDLGMLLRDNPARDDAATLQRQVALLRDVLLGVEKGLSDRIAQGPALRPHTEASDLALQLLPGEPTTPMARFAAGTTLYWAMMEGGMKPVSHFPHPDEFMKAAQSACPEARLPRIYRGEKLAIEKKIAVPESAPAWAGLFHRLLTRVTDVQLWWVNEKQDADGLLGGGFGDDVEATRSWPVSIVIADLEPVREGWRKLAEYGWRGNPYVYQNRMNDIEHGSEDFADSHMFPIFFEHGTDRQKVFLDRASGIWPVFRDVWSHLTPDGYRMFKSSNNSLTEAAAEPAGDSAYGTRCLAPGMFELYFVDDPSAKQLLIEYADNWREAILAERNGKPAGICPVWINPDRSLGLKKDQWWTGMIGIHYPIPIYNVYDLMHAAYELTGDAKYLEPIWIGLDLIGKTAKPSGELTAGSLEWALYATHVLEEYRGERFIVEAAATAREMSGDHGHDDLLLVYGPGGTQSRIRLERGMDDTFAPVVRQLDSSLDTMDYNIEMLTSEVRRTDRIYLRGIDVLLNMATMGSNGGGNASAYWPNFHVTWQDTGSDVSMFVTESRKQQLSALLYSFSDGPKEIGAKFWRLEPGSYEAVLLPTVGARADANADPLARIAFEYTNKGDAVRLTLPSKQQVLLTIRKK